MTLTGTASPERRRRYAALSAVAGLVILPILLTSWNVATALEQFAVNDGLSRTLDALNERLGASDGGAADASGDAENGFLDGETIGVAGAALQAKVAEIIESAQAKTVETELLDRDEEAGPGDLRLRITFEARNDPLQAILLAVENGPTALYLRSLSVEPSGDAWSETGASEPTLRATVVIEGYWRGVGR